MSALNAKPSSSLNGIKYISQSILAILELQNVRNAEEKGFAREKINDIFFVNSPQKKESKSQDLLFFSTKSAFCGRNPPAVDEIATRWNPADAGR